MTVYGRGFAWTVMTIDVAVGDVVRWEWSTPALVDTITYRVVQVDNATATTDTEDGFGSGDIATANGRYTTGYYIYYCMGYWVINTLGFNYVLFFHYQELIHTSSPPLVSIITGAAQ